MRYEHYEPVLEEEKQYKLKEEERLKEVSQRMIHFQGVSESIRRGILNTPHSPLTLLVQPTVESSNNISASYLSLTLTNTTTDEVRISNPLSGKSQEAFWDIRVYLKRAGRSAQYQIALPTAGAANEPPVLIIPQGATVSQRIRINGATIVRDEFYTDYRFSGDPIETLSQPGTYMFSVSLYHRDSTNQEHAIDSNPHFIYLPIK